MFTLPEITQILCQRKVFAQILMKMALVTFKLASNVQTLQMSAAPKQLRESLHNRAAMDT